MDKVCDYCRHWHDHHAIDEEAQERLGTCHRRSPGFDDRDRRAVWPKTLQRDECGDWEPSNVKWPHDLTKPHDPEDDIPF
jgi:hypothetical protein